jgi:hypothetical protein
MNDKAIDTHGQNQLPLLKATWERTSAPSAFRLPLEVEIDVNDGLAIDGVLSDEASKIFFRKEDLLRVLIYLFPDSTAECDQYESDRSIALVRHVDPYGVDPYLESVFTTPKSYYFRALEKGLVRQGVSVTRIDETADSRKLRTIRESMQEGSYD